MELTRNDGLPAVEQTVTAGKPSLLDVCVALFNESQSRIVISVTPENLENVVSVLRERDVLFQQLGKVCGDELRIQVNNEAFAWSIADLYDDWSNSIRRLVESDASAERIPSL